MVRIMNTINDVSRAVLASEEKLGQRLDVKEKVHTHTHTHTHTCIHAHTHTHTHIPILQR